ncbi:hypothetical protein NDU88_000110 [Pleurodeles waltl]|uniref:Uncharacterized protein n=1 Tax=Pleurodeles waltl TaxID=8319 RepID=A0AAV7UQC9_PLEWA|nr:hypothetical protein NDU88_000110 [Pleurodeles waltl]
MAKNCQSCQEPGKKSRELIKRLGRAEGQWAGAWGPDPNPLLAHHSNAVSTPRLRPAFAYGDLCPVTTVLLVCVKVLSPVCGHGTSKLLQSALKRAPQSEGQADVQGGGRGCNAMLPCHRDFFPGRDSSGMDTGNAENKVER